MKFNDKLKRHGILVATASMILVTASAAGAKEQGEEDVNANYSFSSTLQDDNTPDAQKGNIGCANMGCR